MKILYCLISFLLLVGCDPNCEQGEIQCNGSIMEVCTKEGWETMIDCKEYGENFICVDHQNDIEGEIYCEEVLR